MEIIKPGRTDLCTGEESVSVVNKNGFNWFIHSARNNSSLFRQPQNTSHIGRKEVALPAENTPVDAEPLLNCLPVEFPLSTWIRVASWKSSETEQHLLIPLQTLQPCMQQIEGYF